MISTFPLTPSLLRNYAISIETPGAPAHELCALGWKPVRRGLVAKPEDWKWSSFGHYQTGIPGTVEIESEWTALRRGWQLPEFMRYHQSAYPTSPVPPSRRTRDRGHPPLSLHDALRLVQACVVHYNNVRLNSAIGYVTPKDVLAGRQQEIHAERDRKLEAARQQRQSHRQQAA